MNQQQLNYQQQQQNNQNNQNYIDNQLRQQQQSQPRQLSTAEQQQSQQASNSNSHRPHQQNNNYSPTNLQQQQSQSFNSINSLNNTNNSRETPRSSNINQRIPQQQIQQQQQQQQPELQSPTTSASHYTPTASNSPVASQQDHLLNPIPTNSNSNLNSINNINRGEINSTPPGSNNINNNTTKIPQPITRTSFSSGRRESTGNASPVLTTTSRRGSGVPPATIAGEPIHDMDRAIALLKGQKFYAEGFVMKRVEVAADGKTVSLYH